MLALDYFSQIILKDAQSLVSKNSEHCTESEKQKNLVEFLVQVCLLYMSVRIVNIVQKVKKKKKSQDIE